MEKGLTFQLTSLLTPMMIVPRQVMQPHYCQSTGLQTGVALATSGPSLVSPSGAFLLLVLAALVKASSRGKPQTFSSQLSLTPPLCLQTKRRFTSPMEWKLCHGSLLEQRWHCSLFAGALNIKGQRIMISRDPSRARLAPYSTLRHPGPAQSLEFTRGVLSPRMATCWGTKKIRKQSNCMSKR